MLKIAVAFLPGEVTPIGERIVHPFGRACFDELHRLRDGKSRWEREKEVHVILHAADGEGLHAVIASDAAEVGPKAGLEIGVDGAPAFFGAEDAVIEGTNVGVRHAMAGLKQEKGRMPIAEGTPYSSRRGTTDNSPAFQRWVMGRDHTPEAPAGRLDVT